MNTGSLIAMLFLTASLCSGCGLARNAEYQNKINSLVGGRVDRITAQWGAPSRKELLFDGSTVMQWERSEIVSSGGNSVPTYTRVATTYGMAYASGQRNNPVKTYTKTCIAHVVISPDGFITETHIPATRICREYFPLP